MTENSIINRFEIIDHTPCPHCLGTGVNESKKEMCNDCGGLGCPGRTVIVWDDKKTVDYDVQDNGQTLKVFIHRKTQE